MNAKFRRFALFLSFLAGFSFHCTTDKAPLAPYGTIDENLVGAWLYRKVRPYPGLPTEIIYGFLISEKHKMYDLGVEWSTGRLSLLPLPPQATIANACNGDFEIRLEPNWMPVRESYAFEYRIDGNELFFMNLAPSIFASDHYRRSKLGEKVATPVSTEFEVQIDSMHYRNMGIYIFPSAYTGFDPQQDDTVLTITAYRYENNYTIIKIRLGHFAGSGVYELGSETNGNANYEIIIGHQISSISTSQQSHAGSVTIENFDQTNKRCSGTFSFEAEGYSFRDGSFDVPVY